MPSIRKTHRTRNHPLSLQTTKRLAVERAAGKKAQRKSGQSIWEFLLSLENEPIRAKVCQRFDGL